MAPGEALESPRERGRSRSGLWLNGPRGGPPVWRALLGVWLCAFAGASCEAPASSEPAPATSLDLAARLLAESSARKDPNDRARLQWEAARLAEAAFRETGEARAGEVAVALYRELSAGPLACRGELFGAALEAERKGDTELVRSVAKRLLGGGCDAEAQRVLSTVGRNEPDEDERVVSVPLGLEPTGFPEGALRVLDVEHYGSTDAARVVVFLSRPAQYRAGSLPPEGTRGPRLYVDVAGAEYRGNNVIEQGGIVERVRLGQSDEGVRIVLDLRERVYQRVFYLPEPFRLIIDVSNDTPRLHPTNGARPVTRVVLDPGHGGHDPGAIGSTGLKEKDVALDLALRAAPLIARELGIDTLLTRERDEFIPLDQRVARANAFSADLFISLHCNASESPQSHGVMTFVLDESDDALAERVAARENSASEAASQHLAALMSQVMDAESVARSAHFANLLQRASMASLQPAFAPVWDGGVRQAGFFVLAGAQMPAVLFEASFISNSVDEQRLDSVFYRQKLADGIVNAIRAYKNGL